LECLTVSIGAVAEQKGRWMGLIVSACFEIDLIDQPRFAWFSKPSHGKGKRADYRGAWGVKVLILQFFRDMGMVCT
jgi:hypothetical protein